MPTNKIQTGLRINEKTYIKIRYLCAKEQRSLNNLIEHLLQQYVNQYEKENGPISVQAEDFGM